MRCTTIHGDCGLLRARSGVRIGARARRAARCGCRRRCATTSASSKAAPPSAFSASARQRSRSNVGKLALLKKVAGVHCSSLVTRRHRSASLTDTIAMRHPDAELARSASAALHRAIRSLAQTSRTIRSVGPISMRCHCRLAAASLYQWSSGDAASHGLRSAETVQWLTTASIFIGASRKPDDSYQRPEQLLLKYGNRHGLVTGATGTGKTVTLQILAEGFSNAGVPVFCADIKGDLSGIAMMGEAKDFLVERAEAGQARSLRIPGIPGDLLGSVRRAGPPDPRHRLRDGAAAAVAADEPHRSAGRRHQHRLPHRRRGGAAAARPEGSAGAARQHRRARRRDRRALRQCDQAVGRRDPAHAAGPRAAGRRRISSASRR